MPDFVPAISPLSVDRRSLISCSRCRRLKKKCKQEGRARCQRCIETDQVCRYADLADEQSVQDRPGSMSPPASPATKLIFPPGDCHDPPPVPHSPSHPPAPSTTYAPLQSMEDLNMNEPLFPHSQPLQFQSVQDTGVGVFQGPSSPNPDPRMRNPSMSPSHDNYTAPPYTYPHLYPQQSPYDSSFVQNYSADPYDTPFEDTPAHMTPLPLSPNGSSYSQGSPSPTQHYSYRDSHLSESYPPWGALHTSMPSGMVESNIYSEPQDFMQTNTAASTSSLAAAGYSDYAGAGAGAGSSGYAKGCGYCFQGYCTRHGTDNRIRQ